MDAIIAIMPKEGKFPPGGQDQSQGQVTIHAPAYHQEKEPCRARREEREGFHPRRGEATVSQL